MRRLLPGIVVLLLASVPSPVPGQTRDVPSEVEQLLATGTKLNYAVGRWRATGELQVRLDENYRALNVWYLEAGLSSLRLEHLEVMADLRFSVKPGVTEWRPGLALIPKITRDGWQAAFQAKYQADIPSRGTTGHGVRGILFLNRALGERWIPGLVGGGFYRWRGDTVDGFEFWRAGGGVTHLFDAVHGVNVSYFVGWEKAAGEWSRSGFLLVQFGVNLRSDWKYVPAKIVNF